MLPNLDQQIIEELRNILRRCEHVRDPRRLRSLFIDNKIALWRDDLPETTSVSARIQSVIDYLSEKVDERGEWALTLFLTVVLDSVPKGDGLRNQLVDLIQRLQELQARPSEDRERTEQLPPKSTTIDNALSSTMKGNQNLENPLAEDDTRNQKVHRLLLHHFSLNEIQDIAFEINVDFDDLPGDRKSNKARELVLYLARRNRLDELVAICRQQRPTAQWSDE